MNSQGGLAESGHYQGITVVGPWEFEVVGHTVGRNPLKYQLTEIGVFTLVPFEWKGEQTGADQRDGQNNQNQNKEREDPWKDAGCSACSGIAFPGSVH